MCLQSCRRESSFRTTLAIVLAWCIIHVTHANLFADQPLACWQPHCFNASDVFVLSHIPKTGGSSMTSFSLCLKAFGPAVQFPRQVKAWRRRVASPSRCRVNVGEVSVPSILTLNPRAKIAVMFRGVVRHSKSAINHLATHRARDVEVGPLKEHLISTLQLRGIPSYVSWLAGQPYKDFSLYDSPTAWPVNKYKMNYSTNEVQYVGYPIGIWPQWNHRGGGSLEEAKSAVDNLWFVGVTESYSESVCLLRYQVGKFDHRKCACTEGRKRVGEKINDARYVVAFNSSDEETFLELRKDDEKLFLYVLEVFKQHIREAEHHLGVKFLCQ